MFTFIEDQTSFRSKKCMGFAEACRGEMHGWSNHFPSQLCWNSISSSINLIWSVHLRIWHWQCRNVHTNGKSNRRSKWITANHNSILSFLQVASRGRVHAQQSRVWGHVSVQSVQDLSQDQQVWTLELTLKLKKTLLSRDKLFAGKIFYLTPSVRPSMAVSIFSISIVTITKIFPIIANHQLFQKSLSMVFVGVAEHHPVCGRQSWEQAEKEHGADQRGETSLS